jgi:dTDP-3-amino-3,4,6-trideoxy-alpha-D-glucose transaminase
MIQMNDFKRQWLELAADSLSAVERVGASGWYVLGREVDAFEAAMAELSKSRCVVGCGNGLDAIEISLRALGLKPGDKVLTTPLSAFATTLAIVRAGGVPVFVDVDSTGHLDLDRAEDALARHQDIRFMVPVHLFGHPMDLVRLQSIKERFGIVLIEDAAQAVGAVMDGRAVGSAGQAATLSFYPTKNLGAIGDGGALLTDDAELADRFRSLRDYGQSSKYVHSTIGMNSRLDELHAAVLRSAMLPRLPGWTERRRSIARRYQDEMVHKGVTVVKEPKSAESVWHLFPVLVAADRRHDFMTYLSSCKVQTGIHYPRLIPDQEAMREVPGMDVVGDLDRARRFAAEEVSLPIHPYLSDDEVDTVIKAVNAWVEK